MRKRYENDGTEMFRLIDELDEYGYNKPRNIHSISSTVSSLFVAFFLGLFWIALLMNESLPTPLKLSDEKNYPDSFIAERAQHDLKVLMSLGPRVAGSYENEALAVDFLRREITYIQQQANANQIVEMDIQTVSGSYYLDVYPYGTISAYGNVQNVIVKLYSRNSSKHSLLINTHFDSVPGSPGGGDAGVMCVIMLEILRKLSRRSIQPEHNIIFLFNGAEETPLQGSHGFITQHKWAEEVDVFINLDSGGAGGKEMILQSGPEQPWLLKYYNKIPHPYSHVLAEELFQSKIVPSDTDFRIFRDFGNMIGLDFVFFKDGYRYHTSHDGFANIELGSYQHAGDNILCLISNLANASELYNLQEYPKESFIFYDFLELILISYSSSTAMIMHFAVSILSIVIAIKGFHDFGLNLSISSFKYVGLTLSTVFAGWILSVVVNAGIAKIVDILNINMVWYNHPWIILGLYVAPTIGCCCGSIMLLNNLHKKSKLSISAQTQIQIHVVRLMWTIILLLLTILKIRSAYVTFILLVCHVIAASLILIFSLQYSVREWKLMYISATIISLLIIMKLTHSLLMGLIPICGRMGSHKNPDLIIAEATVFFTIIIISPYIPFVTLNQKPSRILQLLIGVTIISFLFSLTPMGFQYSGNPDSPKPQRFWIAHNSRTFRNDTNHVYKRDSGYIFFNLDRNSPNSVKNYLKELSKTKSIEEDCKRSLFCGISMMSPKQIPLINNTVFIPAEQPIVHEPGSLKLNSKTALSTAVTQFNLTASGPSQLTIYVSPRLGVKLVHTNLASSVPSNPIIWNGRSLYVIMFTWGKQKTPLNITLNFETPHNWNSPTFDIALAANLLNNKTFVKTPHFAQFLKQFPSWADPISWVGVYQSWVY